MAISRHPTLDREPPGRDPGITGAVDRLHAEAERAFSEFEAAEGGRATQWRALLRISDALAAHTTIEQELLYPALRELTGRHERAVERHLEQQHLIDLLLVELAAMVPGERRYEAKVRLLADLFRQHVHEQEQAMLPDLDGGLDPGERLRLAADVGAYERELRRAS